MSDVEQIAIEAYNDKIERGNQFDDSDLADTINDMEIAHVAGEAFGKAAHHLGLCDEFEFIGVGGSCYGSINLGGQSVEVRIADHENQTCLYAPKPINIAPGADDFEQTLAALASGAYRVGYIDCDGNECAEEDSESEFIEINGYRRTFI